MTPTSLTEDRLKRRQALGWLGVPLLSSLAPLSGCRRSGPLNVGFLGCLSGRTADLGVGGRNGAQLAIDDLNAAGGLGGQQLVLMPKDDEQKPELARVRLKELVGAGVTLVVGPMTSSIAVAVRPYAAELGLVLVSPTASAPELVGHDDALFCLSPSAALSAAAHAEFLYRQGVRKVTTLADTHNKAFTHSWVEGVQARMATLGGQRGPEVSYTSTPGVSFGDVAQQLLETRPDVVLLVANAADSAVLVQQIRRRDERVRITLTPWAANDPLVQMGGRAMEGVTVMQLIDRSSTAPAYVKFVQRYRERFGDVPGYRSVKAYDSVMLGAHALRQRQSSQTLREALRAVRSHPGLQHALTLDAFGDSTAPLYATRVHNGQFEPTASL